MLYTKNKNLTDTSTQTIVTIPNGYIAHWNMAFIANLHNSINDITLFVNKPSPTENVYIYNGTNISSKENLLIDGNAVFVLQPGDVIKAAAGSAGNIEVVVTFDLLPAPTVFNNFNGS
jgi:uncharacterized Rmd1/YagE family protein